MGLIYVVLISAFSAFSHAAGSVSTVPFTLERRGDEICRLERETAEVCLPTLASLGVASLDEINVRERIRQYGMYIELRKNVPDLKVTSAAIDAFGGAIFLSPEQVTTTLANFEELVVRDIGLSREVRKLKDESFVFPFVASLRWKSLKNIKPNGTLFIEGYIKTHNRLEDAIEIFAPSDTSEIRRLKINQLYEIEGFSDSTADQKHDFFRKLENLGREVHFRVVGTGGKSVEGATLDLLNQIVAPVVFGDAFWLAEMRRTGADVAERLQLR